MNEEFDYKQEPPADDKITDKQLERKPLMSDNKAIEQQPTMFDIEEKVFEPNLMDRFIIPPFSVLDTKIGNWQQRKRNWKSLGIQSEIGREAESFSLNSEDQKKKYDYLPSIATGTSIFDPVLCELMYKWFCPKKGQILDPFAGGSVRGIVAGILDKEYIGIDLSSKQVDANREQAKEIIPDKNVMWIKGDSYVQLDEIPDNSFDMVFSCPPYYDLEVYSDGEADLSTMSYEGFLDAYKGIIAKSIEKLKVNRFACFVIANVRDKQGFYRDLVGETIRAFESAGAKFYNEIILVNTCGSLPIRITKQFQAGRKVGKMHQNVLVFYKGDPKQIKSNF